MTRTAQNIELYTGDDRNLITTIYNSAGAAQNITGASATYTVRDRPGGAILVGPLTVGSGITLTTPLSGILTIAIASSLTEDLYIPSQGLRDLYHELEIVLSALTVTAFTGRFRLRKSVSGAGA